jgi:hypothetical protein
LTCGAVLASGAILARRAGSTISSATARYSRKTLSVAANYTGGRGTHNPLSRRGARERHGGCGKGHSQGRERDRTHERLRGA